MYYGPYKGQNKDFLHGLLKLQVQASNLLTGQTQKRVGGLREALSLLHPPK